MKKVRKIATVLYITIAIFVIIDLVLVYKYKFNLFSRASESGCNVNVLNSNSSDMGDCFYTLGGKSLTSDVARVAEALSSQARALCRPSSTEDGYTYFLQTNRYSINKKNQHCMDSAITSLVPDYTRTSLIQVVSSTDSFDSYQCVGFVQTVVAGVYGKPLNHGGDARDFITNVPSGYRYVDKTQANAKIESGDIPLWDDGINGHIAIALSRADVSTHDYRFRVAEANYQHPGYVNNNRWESSDFPAFKGWLHKI